MNVFKNVLIEILSSMHKIPCRSISQGRKSFIRIKKKNRTSRLSLSMNVCYFVITFYSMCVCVASRCMYCHTQAAGCYDELP